MHASQPIDAGGPRRPEDLSLVRTPVGRRRLAADSIARWVVTCGGIAVILGVLGILVFILAEVAPLMRGARVELLRASAIPIGSPGVLIADEHRTHAAVLAREGRLSIVRLSDGAVIDERPLLAEGSFVRVRVPPGAPLVAGSTADGRVLAVPVDWEIAFDDQTRRVTPQVGDAVAFTLDPEGGPVDAFAVQLDRAGGGAAAAQLADGTVAFVRREVEQNQFTGETTESWQRHTLQVPGRLTEIVLDPETRTLYGGTRDGALVTWDLKTDADSTPQVAGGGRAAVTALTLLVGGRSLVVGRADGRIEIWFPVRQPDESFRLTEIRAFPRRAGAIRLLAASFRDRCFLAQDEGGSLTLYHSTAQRVLWQGPTPLPTASALFYAPKADGAFLLAPGRIVALDIRNPHPEVSARALFGRVWYEGYERPEYVWQSTGGTDDFEPKLSLTPLMFGTLKGTLYSLVLAVPLAVLAAMFTSHFMGSRYRAVVKPTVEIMAALPSVVLGFLAGLWLAPRLERVFPGLLLMVVVLPPLVLATWWAMQLLPRRWRGALASGLAVVPCMVTLALGILACLALSAPFERLAFGGSFPDWLFETTGLRYDQRNAIVVGLAMGFSVIPVIFAIAEDAFSNVPRNLVSGSLALGASRWQTVTRVVLPTASPGIFSAVMIGFGRAVGETMIVLMATGNTPVLDWSAFNGFRTLSANIAVEIPEAAHGGTLYRTLFLAALILFAFTFVVNTAAELIRHRLRRRYGEI